MQVLAEGRVFLDGRRCGVGGTGVSDGQRIEVF
jgi:hypothetical protein